MELEILIVSLLWLTGAQDMGEISNHTSATTMTTTAAVTEDNVTHPHKIAHGCPDAPRIQAGVEQCIYYCRYEASNNTWLFGHYIPTGLDCWADDEVPGRCLEGVCYPDDHDAVTDLPPRPESTETPENVTFYAG
uniref:Sushi domain-containing protein n=1 Tax=Amblyomma maculatum TaxID=34609 RepID=G3MSJ1_AMBMU